MNCLLKLYRAEGFSESERIVACQILQDPEGFIAAPAKGIAAACNVSQATVYRLCSKMNTSGIAELKAHIAADFSEWKQMRAQDVDFNFPVREGAGPEEIVRALKSDYEATVAVTAGLIDPVELDRCAQAVCDARAIDIYSSAGNIHIAENFKLQMLEIGKVVNVPKEEYELRITASCSTPERLAIVLSFAGRGTLMKNLPQVLHGQGTPILLVSSAEPTALDEYADYRLRMAPYEVHDYKVSSFATRLTALFLFDALFTAVFERDYRGNLEAKMDYLQKSGCIG